MAWLTEQIRGALLGGFVPGLRNFRDDRQHVIWILAAAAGFIAAYAAIGFRYGDVEKGKDLEQNILLQDGDIVMVP